MISISMQALIDHLLNRSADEWSDTDWAVVAAAAGGHRKSGWSNPGDMAPVVQLMDSIWKGWNCIPTANQRLALEILGELVNDLADASRDFIAEMQNGQVIYEDAMHRIQMAEWDVDDDDDDDYLPFGSQTSIDDDNL